MKDLALFIMQGQVAQKEIQKNANIVPEDSLFISKNTNLAEIFPAVFKESLNNSEAYKIFYIFEFYLRGFILECLTEKNPDHWWSLVPENIQKEILAIEEVDDMKSWMAHSSRSKLQLATLAQLISIIDDNKNWINIFEEQIKDRALVKNTRTLVHTRNLTCHMHEVNYEEIERLKQFLRDWFRIISP